MERLPHQEISGNTFEISSVSGADVPDLIVMAMAYYCKAQVLTWDLRYLRSVVLKRGYHWPLLVAASEMPLP